MKPWLNFHVIYVKGWRSSLIDVVAYGMFAAALTIMVQNLPNDYFGALLTIVICVALTGSIYFLLATRWTFLRASPFVWLFYFIVDQVNAQKSALTSFPLILTDLRAFLDNPLGFLIAFGAPDWTYFALSYIAYGLALLLLMVAIAVIWKIGPKHTLIKGSIVAVASPPRFGLQLVKV